MRKVRKMVVMLLIVFGAVSVSFGADWKDLSQYKELKVWIEDMKANHPMLKTDDLETIEEYGEYPRLTEFINDLEFVDDFDVEVKKEENKGKSLKQVMRKLANSPKWNGANSGKTDTHYYDGMNDPSVLLQWAKKEAKIIERDLGIAEAKAGAFREMGGEIRIRKWSE